MKIYKTKKGYCYKEYKNGKKKRISNEEYNKLRKNNNKKQKGGSNPPAMLPRNNPFRTAISLNNNNNNTAISLNNNNTVKHKIIKKSEIIRELKPFFGSFNMNILTTTNKNKDNSHDFYSIMFDYVNISPKSNNVTINFDKEIKLQVGKSTIDQEQKFLNKTYTFLTDKKSQQNIINHIKYKLTVLIKLTDFFKELQIYDEIMSQDWRNPSILILCSPCKIMNTKNRETFYTDIPYRTNLKQYNKQKYIYIGWVDVYLSRCMNSEEFNIYIYRRKLSFDSSTQPFHNIRKNTVIRNNNKKCGKIIVSWGKNPTSFASRTGYVSPYRQFAHLTNEQGIEIPNTIAFENLNKVKSIGCLTINNTE